MRLLDLHHNCFTSRGSAYLPAPTGCAGRVGFCLLVFKDRDRDRELLASVIVELAYLFPCCIAALLHKRRVAARPCMALLAVPATCCSKICSVHRCLVTVVVGVVIRILTLPSFLSFGAPCTFGRESEACCL